MKLSKEYLEYELELARYDRDEAERLGESTEDAQCRIDNLEAELRHIENIKDALIGKASEE